MEPVFTGTKALSTRGEAEWIAFAISSLPVPLSPLTSTVERDGATWATRSRSVSILSLFPMMLGKLERCLSARFRWTFSSRRRRDSTACATCASNSSLDHGLVM